MISPAPPTTETILQRVPSTDPSVPTVHLQRVSTTDLSTPFPLPPLPRPSRTPNKVTSCLFLTVIPADAPAQSQHFFKYIGRRFIDTETQERFVIHSVVLPTKQTGADSKTCHFRFYDFDKHLAPPSDPAALKHTPCSEILQKRSPYVEFMDAPPAAAVSSLPAVLPLAAAASPLAAAASPPAAPYVVSPLSNRKTFRWQNRRRIPLHPLSPALANAIQTTLNLNADGTPLNYRGTKSGPNSTE